MATASGSSWNSREHWSVPMSDSSLSLDHRLSELQQVAADLRAARRAGHEPRAGVTGSVRTALGRAFLSVAAALLADPHSTRLAHR